MLIKIFDLNLQYLHFCVHNNFTRWSVSNKYYMSACWLKWIDHFIVLVRFHGHFFSDIKLTSIFNWNYQIIQLISRVVLCRIFAFIIISFDNLIVEKHIRNGTNNFVLFSSEVWKMPFFLVKLYKFQLDNYSFIYSGPSRMALSAIKCLGLDVEVI